MINSSFIPYLLYDRNIGSPVQQNVLNRSVEQYYSWNNMKKQIALNAATQSFFNDSDSPATAAATGLATYATLTVGEKVAKWYSGMLKRAKDKHPKFADFMNGHPIIGNIIAWIPGASLVVSAAGGFAALAAGFIKNKSVQSTLGPLNRSPAFKWIVLGSLVVGAITTSFLGILAGKGIKSIGESGKEYRDTRKERPDLTPQEVKQLVKADRNQRALAQSNNYQAQRMRSYLDPNYGISPTNNVFALQNAPQAKLPPASRFPITPTTNNTQVRPEDAEALLSLSA